MQLIKILKGIDYQVVKGNTNIEIEDIVYDSRQATKKTIFVALIGIDQDGHNYIDNAIDNGCKCIIICHDIQLDKYKDITIIKVKDTRKELAYLSANLFDNPSDKLIKIGITGTKGKTTVSYMIKCMLEKAGYKVGLIGTNGTIIDNKLYSHKNTTPESYLIQKYMNEMVKSNTKFLVMEVSSQALKVGRVSNINYDYAIFTNLSLDHVGQREHENYEDYANSKSLLFKNSSIAILNKDDKEYERMIKNINAKIYTYGKEKADLILENISYYSDQNFLGVKLNTSSIVKDSFLIRAPGLFSAYNAMSVILLGYLLKIDINDIKYSLSNFKVDGRCQVFNLKRGIKVIIDYAHNKISMESIIKTMKEYKNNRIITVFGCGGGRSYERRFELGEMSGLYADLSIVTMDNPRNDSLEEINRDIVKGITSVNGKYKVIEDREEAIKYAIENAQDNDLILLLGKGHEKFQQIKDKIYALDEEAIVQKYLK